MRGTRGGVFGRERQAGIIPAYAGNTGCPSVRPCVRWDHPRVCGEHFNAVRNATSPQGSSPRMRGTLQLDIQLCGAGGIIPAYAGNTATCRCIVMNSRDHPRVCGEHCHKIFRQFHKPGSSPRMRGTPRAADRMPFDIGIIPAYAGNTLNTPDLLDVRRDHPRVCGEHPFRSGVHAAVRGSSPRMRGTPAARAAATAAHWIIPAYAGNTPTFPWSTTVARDHPRVCGEHCSNCLIFHRMAGSSPRMRGTHFAKKRPKTPRGIIPAYAGNTCCRW